MKTKFTEEENHFIIDYALHGGHDWMALSKSFKDKTHRDLKNHFHSTLKRRKMYKDLIAK